MDFRIQASNPRTIAEVSPDDAKVEEAMETVFPMWAEDAVMVWAGVHIPLNYKYAMSSMFGDIMTMLRRLLVEAEGELCIRWPVQEFEATWTITWKDDLVQLHSEWHSTPNFTGSLLAQRPSTIMMNKSDYMAEWKQPLWIIWQAVRKAGYDETQLTDLSALRRTLDAIPRSGILYRDA